MNCKDWQQSMMKPVAGLIVLLTAVAMASDVDAKRNPPGCQNANAAAHNPNCQGGGSTHVTVPSPQPTTNVQTIVVTPAATQSGGGLTSNTPKPQAPVVVKPSPQQTYTGHSPYYVPPDPPAQQTPQPMTQVAPPQLFSNTAPALKPGFQKFPTWQGKRDPATGYPVPPNPPAQQTPQPMTQVAPPQLFSNTAPALKPGFQKFPTWQGKRDPATGYPVPPNPPAQQTPQPMTQVAPPQLFSNTAPALKPGFQKFPTWQGKRDPATGYPVPPNPPAQQTPQPMTQVAPPQLFSNTAPALKPGFQKFPTWQGKRDPATGYPVPPNPPAQQTPQPMTQVAPPQLFSNTAPALKPGFQKFPTWQGKRDPATGYPVPPNPPAQQTPQPMTQVAPPQPSPQAKPQLVPNQIVTASPQQTYTGYSPHFVGAPLTVGQTSSSQSTQKQILMHIQNSATQNPGTSFIPPKPGRNFIEGYRAYYVDRNSVLSACVLSGLGKRTTKNQVNAEWSVGHSETLHFRSTSTAHLPSNRAHASHHCLVTVNKSPVR